MIDRLAAIEETFLVTIPGVRFLWKSIDSVGSALVVAVNHFNVLELVAWVVDLGVGFGGLRVACCTSCTCQVALGWN